MMSHQELNEWNPVQGNRITDFSWKRCALSQRARNMLHTVMAGNGRYSMGKFILCSTVMVGLVWYRVQMFEDVYNAPATAMEHRTIQMHLQGAIQKAHYCPLQVTISGQ